MRAIQLLPIFLAAVVLGAVVAHSFVRADLQYVTVRDGGLFIVANSYPTNSTYLGLTAGHWGEMFNVTTLPIVNSTLLVFTVFQNYQMLNQTVIQNLNSTLRGSGTFTIYLDLGSSSISEPEYTDVKWLVA